MGSCLYKVFFIGGPPAESLRVDDEWKKQTRGKVENVVYSLMDVKRGGEIVNLYKKGGRTLLEAALRGDKILLPYLYEGGQGKTVKKKDFLLARRRKRSNQGQPALDINNTAAEVATEYPDVTACWSLEHRGDVGETVLHLCFLNNTPVHTEIAHVLLNEYPALAMDQYENEDYFGETALHIAIVNGDLPSVKLLVEKYNADVHARARGRFFMPEDYLKTQTKESNFNGYAYYGEYPASFAACFDNKEIYDFLIRRGTDPNLQDTFGNTVLHLCVVHNKVEMLEHVLKRKHKLKPDLAMKNDRDLTPLTLAATLGRQQMFHHILELSSVEFWSYGDVTCSAYPLDGLDSIGKHGKSDEDAALLIAMAGDNDDHLDLLTCGIMYRLLEEKWNAYAKRQFFLRLMFAVLYLTAFSLAIYLRPRDLQMKRINTAEDKLRITCEALVALGAVTYLVLEVKNVLLTQGARAMFRSFHDAPAKGIFLLSCVLVIIALPCRYLDLLEVETRCLVIAAPMAWCYLLFFCRGFGAIGPFVNMVYKMCAGDMSRFGIIYIVFVLGLTQGFHHVMKGSNSVGLDGYENEGYTFLTLMMMSFGEFDYLSLEKSKYPLLAKLLFFYFMTFVAILLLNMLIAMMANTYQSIADRAEKEWRRQWAHIIVVLERSVSPQTLMKYQDEYSVKLEPTESQPRRRGIMVIKKKNASTKAEKQKFGVSNWQVLGSESVKSQLLEQAVKL